MTVETKTAEQVALEEMYGTEGEVKTAAGDHAHHLKLMDSAWQFKSDAFKLTAAFNGQGSTKAMDAIFHFGLRETCKKFGQKYVEQYDKLKTEADKAAKK